MSRSRRAASDDSLKCSFCHKQQDAVEKLISSPSDYPRAYICDECVAVCSSVLEDEKAAKSAEPPSEAQVLREHLAHSLEYIPDADLPTLGRILHALADRTARVLREKPGEIVPISAANETPDPKADG